MSIAARRLLRGVTRSLPTSSNNVGSAPIGTTTYTVPAGAIHVAKTGSDANPGTAASPKLTIAGGISAVASNGTVVVRAGEYNEGGATANGMDYGVTVPAAKTGVTIQAAPNEAVWMDGSQVVTGWTVHSTGVWKAAWDKYYDHSPTFSRGASEDSREYWKFVNAAYPCAHYSINVFLNGVALTPVNSLAKLGPGKFYPEGGYPYTATSGTQNQWVQHVTTVYLGDDPSGNEVRITNKTTSLFLFASGCSLKGIGIRRYGPCDADMGALHVRDDALIENVVMQDITAMGATSYTGSGTIWRNTTIQRIGGLGLHNDTSNNVVYENMLFEYCNNRFFNYAPVCAGLKVSRMNGVVVKNCVFRNNYAPGFWTDVSVKNADMINCDVYNNEDIGIIFEVSDGLRLVNTRVIGNGSAGIRILSSDHVYIWNCLFANNGFGTDRFTGSATNGANIVNHNDDRKIGSTGWTEYADSRYMPSNDTVTSAAYMDWDCSKLVINNTISSKGKRCTVEYLEDLESSHTKSGESCNPETASNLYHVSGATYPFVWTTGTNNPVHNIWWSLDSVKAAKPTQEINSVETASDPLSGTDITASARALVTTSVPLPADIATLAGKQTGTAYLGPWLNTKIY